MKKPSRILTALLGVAVLIALPILYIFYRQYQEIPVLNYHKIDYEEDNPLVITPEEFDQQMAYLSRFGYHAITPDALLAHIEAGKELPERPVLITFDDGYRDNYLNAYPILKKYGFAATIFLITDFVDHNEDYLTWDQVLAMRRDGFVFGSHTLNHVPLTGLRPEEILFQLEKSKEGIEWRIDAPVKYLAYPTGAYSPEVIKLVKQAGYQAAFSIDFGRIGKTNNIYALKRIPIFRSRLSFYSFYLRLQFTPVAHELQLMKEWIVRH